MNSALLEHLDNQALWVNPGQWGLLEFAVTKDKLAYLVFLGIADLMACPASKEKVVSLDNPACRVHLERRVMLVRQVSPA